jgi:Icc-related predicted phosphoesterase
VGSSLLARFGVIGDVHGNFTALQRILLRHPDLPFWLCVGDLASQSGAYPEPPAPLYWIKGNNESFDRIEAFAAGRERIENLHYIPNGSAIEVHGLRVAGLGGTHAPTWYDTPAGGLPVRGKDDKRRHFVRDEVEACRALGRADVLLTHEAPKPFWVDLPSSSAAGRRWRRDVGKEPIAEAADALTPRLHLFGHHHMHKAMTRNGIPTVCVDRVNRSYLIVDARTFEFDLLRTEDT